MKKYFLGGLLLIALFLVSLIVGAVDIPVGDVFRILGSAVGLTSIEDGQGVGSYIVLNSRLPQAVTARRTYLHRRWTGSRLLHSPELTSASGGDGDVLRCFVSSERTNVTDRFP